MRVIFLDKCRVIIIIIFSFRVFHPVLADDFSLEFV